MTMEALIFDVDGMERIESDIATSPLQGEPRCLMARDAWPSLDELTRLARPPRPLTAVQALYRGAPR